MAIYTYSTNANGVWNTATWSIPGFPNAIDDEARLDGDITTARQVSIPVNSTYTIGKLLTNDSSEPYTDWNVVGSNALTSILNFQTSSGIPLIQSVDGGNISVRLAGTQGLRLEGGGATAGDTVIISNANNTLYGPLQFEYSSTSSITGKLTASGSISSSNNFAGVAYTGILGLLGKVDLLNPSLNIRNINFLGDLDISSELSSSNGSNLVDNPAAHDTDLKISAPIFLSGTNQWGNATTAGKIIEYSGVISGVSPALNPSSVNTFGMNNNVATGSTIFRLTNPNNTFTGTAAFVLTQNGGNDTFDGQAILEYNTIANAGQPSSVGAGAGSFMMVLRTSTYRCIGSGGTSNRQLAPWSAASPGGNYSLENNGTGPIIFNNTTSSLFGQWPVLGGSNLHLNEISQPLYFTKPLVKDGTGRWVLSGEKRYLPLASYNAGPKPWLTSTGKTLIEAGYANDFISVLGGYLRFTPTTDLRHQATNAIANTIIQVYSGSTLELSGTGIASSYPVAATATLYGSTLKLNGNGANNDGALINLSGSNTISSIVNCPAPAVINIQTGSLLFNYYFNGGTATISGSGDVTFNSNNWLTSTTVVKANTGLGKFAGNVLYNSTLTNTTGTLELSGTYVSPGSFSGYLNVSGGITQTVTSTATRVFNGIILNTGSFVHTLDADLQLSGTVLYSHTSASNVFSYTYPTGRVLKLIAGAGFGTQENKTGSIDIAYDSSGAVNTNITTEANSLLTIHTAYSSSTDRGFNKNGDGTVVLITSSSYFGANNLYAGVTVAKHKNVFGRSALNVQGGTLATAADMHLQIVGNLTLNGGSINFGSNV
jgi:fibronectin-binding autotransporter adhesin